LMRRFHIEPRVLVLEFGPSGGMKEGRKHRSTAITLAGLARRRNCLDVTSR
jgi:hypothetical protein